MTFKLPVLAFVGAVMVLGQTPQATIRVEVTSDSAPVPDAEVTANGNHVRTGKDGMAVFPTELGHVDLVVTKEGFFPARKGIDIDAAQEWHLQFELEPQRKHEEEVTVHATRNDVRVQDSPLHVEVVSQDEITEEMAMRPSDISMLLNEMGGMRVQTTSPGLGAAAVRVQGMRGRYTAFLSDGLPLFGQQGTGLGLLQIPPMDLGQVEVIKGNASALYGSAAMAGVVNLITRRPEVEPIHEFLFNRSSLGETDVSMFLASQLAQHWGASLLGGGYWQEHQDVNGDGWAALAGYSRGVFRPRFFWDNKNGGTALLTGGITYEDRSGGTVPGAVLPVTGQPYIEGLNTRRYDFGGNAQWVLDKRFVVAARFSISDQDHRHQYGDDLERDRYELLFGEVSIRGTAGKNTWVAGFADERDAFRPHDVPRFAYTYVVSGIFAQDDFNVAPWLSLSASARVDFHNVYGTFFSPRLSALIRKGGWTSRISAGQGFYAATPLTEETEAAGLARLLLPVPLRAERGRSASADLTRSMGPLAMTATFFASNIDHSVYVDRGATYEIFNLQGPTRNRGLELLATWRKSAFAATASYTYVRTSELEPTGRAEVPLTPRHSLGIVGMWEKEGVTRIGLELLLHRDATAGIQPVQRFVRAVRACRSHGGAQGRRAREAFCKSGEPDERASDAMGPVAVADPASDRRWTVDGWAPLEGRIINGGVRLSF